MTNSIMNKFDVMERMVAEVACGRCPSLVISGPAGIGKTFTVTKELKKFMEHIAPLMGFDVTYNVCSGAMTPINLYKQLYENRAKNNVLVLDDIDTILEKLDALNLLKAALDLSDGKTIGYYSESHALRRERIPNEFMFEGSVIFLTNMDLKTGPKSLQPHFDAFLSRSHYIDLGMRTPDELMEWAVNTITNTDILSDISERSRDDILHYMVSNKNQLNEISLRMVKKLANLSHMGEDWQDIANITCLDS